MILREPAGRQSHQIRPIVLETGISRYAEGSVLIHAGHTQVLCTATIEKTVPSWLMGQGKGWITAEYAMLPRSTHTRTKRDREKMAGRSQEIQRLIGRSLRLMVDLKKLGERSIVMDCDVLQADGGTRTASITGACVALRLALENLIRKEEIPPETCCNTIAAVSVGMKNGEILVDLDYHEDSNCDCDVNFVMTGNGQFVEIQGTAEKKTFSEEQFRQMTVQASHAIQEIQKIQLNALRQSGIENLLL